MLYNVNLFQQIKSDFFKILSLYGFKNMNRLSFYLLWETLCFVYNIAVESVHMDTLGNQSVQILNQDK